MGRSPGGFRVWWRQWHGDSDAELDNAHLMRVAGRFARRVRGWANANGVPVIDCKAGERKHEIAEDYLAEHPELGCGVFHEHVACQARRSGVSFHKEGNCFTTVTDPDGLAQIADTLSHPATAGRLGRVIDRWIYTCLAFGLDLVDQVFVELQTSDIVVSARVSRW